MLLFLNKLFVRSFYAANTGFFLFFFFVFVAAVPGGTLVIYHQSIMLGILGSVITTCLVLFCWLLYHLKCVSFVLKIISRPESNFLAALQAINNKRQWLTYFILYAFLYAPVLIYSFLLSYVSFKNGFEQNAFWIILFQVVSLIAFTSIIYYRLNNWLYEFQLPAIKINFPKYFLLYNVYYFLFQKRTLLLILKSFSILLLYISLVWNIGKYDNSSFLLFYLTILMAHAILPYLSVQFLEKEFMLCRNTFLPLYKRAFVFLVPYILFLLPELAYIVYHANAFPLEHRLAYFINLVASLFLLTAVQYSDAFNRNEYLKASFGLFFISIFFLHVQAFWIWISTQFLISMVLFRTGYYNFEPAE